MRKTTEIEAQINALLDEVTRLTFIIRRKVIDGESASEPRARRLKIESQVAELRGVAASAESKAERVLALAVAESAEEIARAALQFVEDKLLLLKPPKKARRPKNDSPYRTSRARDRQSACPCRTRQRGAHRSGGRSRIAKRIEDLTAERAAIVAAERSGSSAPAAAPRLAVIDEDIADLKSILGTADGELAKPRSDAAQALQRPPPPIGS
jgi:hypothetical protein